MFNVTRINIQQFSYLDLYRHFKILVLILWPMVQLILTTLIKPDPSSSCLQTGYDNVTCPCTKQQANKVSKKQVKKIEYPKTKQTH